MSKECLFYDKVLQQTIPCLLIPNELYEIKTDFDRTFYCHVSFDNSKFIEYGVTKENLTRYSKEMVPIVDIYPATTQIEKNYAQVCIPNNISSTENHSSNELDRFEKIIEMITDVEGDIKADVFYKLAEFISYELLFMYCNNTERLFMLNLIHNQFTEQPSTIYVPQIIRMTRKIFNKYADSGDEYSNYKIHNYKKFSDFYYVDFPILINIDNLDYNVHYIDV